MEQLEEIKEPAKISQLVQELNLEALREDERDKEVKYVTKKQKRTTSTVYLAFNLEQEYKEFLKECNAHIFLDEKGIKEYWL